MMFKKIGLISAALLMTAGSFGSVAGIAHAEGATENVLTDNPNGSELGGTSVSQDGKTAATAESKAAIGFGAGNLTLNFVPNFDFGKSHTVGTTDSFPNMFADGDAPSASTPGRNLVVTDTRDANTGWNVTAKLGNFTETGGTSLTTPTTLTLNLAQNMVKSANLQGTGTSVTGVTLDGTGTDAPTIAGANVALEADGDAQAVLNAADTTGSKTWALDFQDKGTASLTVPIAQQGVNADYTAPVTWTLGAASVN